MVFDDDDERRRLFVDLERVLGTEGARRLMAALPPFPWEEVARKQDLTALRDYLDERLDQQQAHLDERLDQQTAYLDERLGQQTAYLDERLGQQTAYLDERLGQQQAYLDERLGREREFLDLRLGSVQHEVIGAFRGELNSAVVAQTRMLVFSVLGSVVSSGGLVLAAARLAA